MRNHATTWVLALTLILGELHTVPIFSDDPMKTENWILRSYKPMTESWNMYYLESQLIKPLYFLAFLLWKRNKVNITTIKAFLFAGVIDTGMYFYNFKDPLFFGSFYVWMAAIWFLVYHWGLIRKQSPKTWKKWINSNYLSHRIKR